MAGVALITSTFSSRFVSPYSLPGTVERRINNKTPKTVGNQSFFFLLWNSSIFNPCIDHSSQETVGFTKNCCLKPKFRVIARKNSKICWRSARKTMMLEVVTSHIRSITGIVINLIKMKLNWFGCICLDYTKRNLFIGYRFPNFSFRLRFTIGANKLHILRCKV